MYLFWLLKLFLRHFWKPFCNYISLYSLPIYNALHWLWIWIILCCWCRRNLWAALNSLSIKVILYLALGLLLQHHLVLQLLLSLRSELLLLYKQFLYLLFKHVDNFENFDALGWSSIVMSNGYFGTIIGIIDLTTVENARGTKVIEKRLKIVNQWVPLQQNKVLFVANEARKCFFCWQLYCFNEIFYFG